MRAIFFGFVLVVVVACPAPQDEPPESVDEGILNLPSSPFNCANPSLPPHFVESGLDDDETSILVLIRDRTPAENPVTDEGATLGRVFFYDVLLSQKQTISCSSCHKPEFGFSDDRVLSKGFLDGDTGRHSMGLANARYNGNGRYFWDERAGSLEEQVLMPLQDEVEMGMTLDEVVSRVAAAEYYPALFSAAFGDDEVSGERISFALAQFVRSMVSFSAPYDEGRAQVGQVFDDFPNFTASENLGKRLFAAPLPNGGFDCIACHLGEAFVTAIATSNGLDAVTSDRGVGGVLDKPEDDGRFRVPSLRNIAVRAAAGVLESFPSAEVDLAIANRPPASLSSLCSWFASITRTSGPPTLLYQAACIRFGEPFELVFHPVSLVLQR
ncbi:MAG: cytochrome-c peroxidase [Deltaproteobacteria bacterium]|nr:cytochrome-c peroxidase [Deltaproteobacteria bacterium]